MNYAGEGQAAVDPRYAKAQANTPPPTRQSRTIENAISETERAIGRVQMTLDSLRQNTDRILGGLPMPGNPSAGLGGDRVQPPQSDTLSTTLANLHAHLDTLGELAERLERI